MENSAIEWTDHTFNPWIGCTKVSPGCDHCYAERQMDKRLGVAHWGAGQPRTRTSPSNWREPLRWNKQAQAEGRRYRVFCASLADVFDNEVDPAWRADLFQLIDSTPHLDWLLLTKRIGNAGAAIRDALDDSMLAVSRWPWPHVWIGASIVNQAEADRDIPKLLAVPAAKRFLSMEPLLGDVRLGSWLQRSPSAAFDAGLVTAEMPEWTRLGSTAIDWVIVGGESGPGARPMHPAWARSLRDQCTAAGVPFFFKQWGEWASTVPADFPGPHAWVRKTDGAVVATGMPALNSGHWAGVWRAGKKAAGRLLDGRTWDEVPHG